MSSIDILGIDLAKQSFSLHGVDKIGRCNYCKTVRRTKLLSEVSKISPRRVVMEACGSSNYWAREFMKIGIEVALISPQHVVPFVQSQKNDANDAKAIVEADSRPSMRYVPVKQVWQQDMQTLHRIRERFVGNRVALGNQIRAILFEYGITLPQGVGHLRRNLPEIISSPPEGLTVQAQGFMQELWSEFIHLEEKIKGFTSQIEKEARSSEPCRRLMEIPGVGPLIATIFVASMGDGREFKNGRHASAWVGLVPRQHSTGGKPRLLGITKRGDTYLRKLVIQGARAKVRCRNGKDERITRLEQQKGFNKTAVAVANKNVRIMWSLLAKGTEYNTLAS